MDPLLLLLRLLHIVLGSLWVGIIVFNAVFLGPTVAELGPDGGKVMGALQRRGMMTFLPAIGLLTLLSGAWLLYEASLGFEGAYFRSGPGHAYSMGGGLAIVGFLLGIGVMRPAMLRVMAIAQGMAQVTDEATRAARQAEMQRLRARASLMGRVVAVLLVVATAAMAVARYL
ncbi:MAG: hypothetical protein KJZ47_07920 [Gemmatimonadales bacterium]|nr:hypothetical protein [Gemmatimonadales bacterium]